MWNIFFSGYCKPTARIQRNKIHTCSCMCASGFKHLIRVVLCIVATYVSGRWQLTFPRNRRLTADNLVFLSPARTFDGRFFGDSSRAAPTPMHVKHTTAQTLLPSQLKRLLFLFLPFVFRSPTNFAALFRLAWQK